MYHRRNILIFKKFQTLSFIKNIVRLPLKHTSVDIQLYSLAMVNILVVVIMIVEYLLRHLTSLEPLFIYNFYSETVHVLSATTLFLIVNFIIKSNYKFAA